MSPLGALAILGAGLAAGTINAVVGSGTLVTFPTLLALGYPPVLANVSNTVGLAPGSLAGALGYRAELAGQRGRLVRLGAFSMLGAGVGAVLLLTLDPDAFEAVVPVLIGVSCVLVVVQPWLARRLSHRRGRTAHGGVALAAGIFLTGIYGGYFGAAQGVLLIGLLGVLLEDDLQRANAAKNIFAFIANGVAAVVFIVVTHVAWGAAGLIAAGSVAGGLLGAKIGRRLPAVALRLLIVLIGVVAIVHLVRP